MGQASLWKGNRYRLRRFREGAGYPIYRSKFPHSNAVIKVSEDGHTAILYCGETDIGQGSMTVLAQIAAEAMGITYDRLKVVFADTDSTPLGFGSYSSRVTLMGGNACKMAGEDIKQQMLNTASRMLNVPAEYLEIRENRVFSKKNNSAELSWHDVAAKFFFRERPFGWSRALFSAGRIGRKIQRSHRRDLSSLFLFRLRVRSGRGY